MLREEIRKVIADLPLSLKEEKNSFILEGLLAERKAFLSSKKISYIARFRFDESKKELRFTEMLKETGSGLSMGNVDDTPGFGFKTETYKTSCGKPREGTIEEQSALFGKKYSYQFNYACIRKKIETLAVSNGYTFHYSLLGV